MRELDIQRLGSLCTGYAGLDRAVEEFFGARMVWYSEIEKHPSTLLAQRFPGVPNLGDLKRIDWAAVPRVDVLTAGYPCQPFSMAGKRQGEEDERHLWPFIRAAVRELRPRITVLENVSGHLSKGFGSVLADCAEDGLSVRWTTVRASDAGAPHERERIYVVIAPDPQSFGFRAPRGFSEVSGTSADGCEAAAHQRREIRPGSTTLGANHASHTGYHRAEPEREPSTHRGVR